MNAVPLTKRDIAEAQLNLAVSLFVEEREYIAALTLAGAAEEILGKMLALRAGTPALARRIQSARRVHAHLWPKSKDPGDKPFADLKNKARNELKHWTSGHAVALDIREECARMLDRAVENYTQLYLGFNPVIAKYRSARRLLRQRLNGA